MVEEASQPEELNQRSLLRFAEHVREVLARDARLVAVGTVSKGVAKATTPMKPKPRRRPSP